MSQFDNRDPTGDKHLLSYLRLSKESPRFEKAALQLSMSELPSSQRPSDIGKEPPQFNSTGTNQSDDMKFIKQPADVYHFYPVPFPDYNPEQKPADKNQAIRHGKAHQISLMNNDLSTHAEYDESTGLRADNNTFPLCQTTHKLGNYGPVLPMYFTFIKQILFAFVLLIAFSVIIVIHVTHTSNKDVSLTDYKGVISAIASDDAMVFTLIIGSFIFKLIFFILGYYYRGLLKHVKTRAKKKTMTPSDYTVMIYNLGKYYQQDEINTHFGKMMVPGHVMDVQKISISYNIESLVQLARLLHSLIRKKNELKEQNAQRELICPIEENIMTLNNYLNRNQHQLKKCMSLKRNGVAFVTYNTKQEAKSIRRKYEMSIAERWAFKGMQSCTEEFHEYFFKDNQIRCEKAPEIHDIIWEGLDNNTSRTCYGLIWFLIYLSVIAITTVGLYFLEEASMDEVVYNFLFAGALLASNFIIRRIILSQVKTEKFFCTYHITNAIIFRQSILQFLNSVSAIVVNQFILHEKEIDDIANLILIVAFVDYIVQFLFKFIDVRYILFSLTRNSASNFEKCKELKQKELNHLFEKPQLNIHEFYPMIIQVLFFTFTFGHISPYLPLLAFIALFLVYWVDKFTILRRRMLPTTLRSEIPEEAFDLFDYAVFFSSLGTLFLLFLNQRFIKMSEDNEGVSLTFVMFEILLAGVYCILPNKRIARGCCAKRKISANAFTQPLFHEQAKEFFQADYWIKNPVLRDVEMTEAQKELYEETLKAFDGIEILHHCPELLPIFDYAVKTVDISKVIKGEATGTKNPYFYYPHNYRFGDDNFVAPGEGIFGRSDTANFPERMLEINHPHLGGMQVKNNNFNSNTNNSNNTNNRQSSSGRSQKQSDNSLKNEAALLSNIKTPEDRNMEGKTYGDSFINFKDTGLTGNSEDNGEGQHGMSFGTYMSPINGRMSTQRDSEDK